MPGNLPDKYNADALRKMAKDAGMKYLQQLSVSHFRQMKPAPNGL